MARLKDIATRVTDLLQIDPRKIEIDSRYNMPGRVFDAKDEEDRVLLDSIRANGVRTPLTVRVVDDRVIVIAGHRRLGAVKQLIEEGVEIMTVPCLSEQRGTNDADRDADLIISNTHKKISPLQQAVPIKRLLGHGWSEEDIAQRTGLSLIAIRQALELAAADSSVQELVQSGSITPNVAQKALRKNRSETAKVLKEAQARAKQEGSKRVTARHVESVKSALPLNEEKPQGRKLQISKQDLTKTLRSILETDDIAIAHHLARVCLRIRKTHLEIEENAETLRAFAVEPPIGVTIDKDHATTTQW